MNWRVVVSGMVLSFMLSLLWVPTANGYISATTSLSPTSPDKVYQGEPTTFKLTLYNLGGGGLDVYQVKANFPWSIDYYFKSDDGNTLTIPGGSSYDFTGTVTVSQTASLDAGTVSIQVHGIAAGDWLSSWPTYTNSITVYPITTLVASVTGNPNSGTAPLDVNFQSAVTGGISPYTYSWVFGDGDTSSSANPTHTYSAAGSYTAQVTVTDSASSTNRQTASDDVTINVQTFSLMITFSKPDGSLLTNTSIYYGTSQGQETSVFGTTDSSGTITSTNSAFASQTLYFKSSDGKYSGNAYVNSTGGTVLVSTTETSVTEPSISISVVIGIIFVVGVIAVAGVVAWRKARSKSS